MIYVRRPVFMVMVPRLCQRTRTMFPKQVKAKKIITTQGLTHFSHCHDLGFMSCRFHGWSWLNRADTSVLLALGFVMLTPYHVVPQLWCRQLIMYLCYRLCVQAATIWEYISIENVLESKKIYTTDPCGQHGSSQMCPTVRCYHVFINFTQWMKWVKCGTIHNYV